MGQRDTLLPVCRVVDVDANAVSGVALNNSGRQLKAIKISGGSNYDTVTTLNLSGSRALNRPGSTSAVAVMKAGTVDGVAGVPIEVFVTEPGAYTSAEIANLGVSGGGHVEGCTVDPGPSANSQGGVISPATFTVETTEQVATVNYVSVTDLSGADGGFFRVAPASGDRLYASAASNFLNAGTDLLMGDLDFASGIAGVIGAPGDTVTLSLQEPFSGIEIENQLIKSSAKTRSRFAINYGIIHQANPRSDSQTGSPL